MVNVLVILIPKVSSPSELLPISPLSFFLEFFSNFSSSYFHFRFQSFSLRLSAPAQPSLILFSLSLSLISPGSIEGMREAGLAGHTTFFSNSVVAPAPPPAAHHHLTPVSLLLPYLKNGDLLLQVPRFLKGGKDSPTQRVRVLNLAMVQLSQWWIIFFFKKKEVLFPSICCY